MAQSAFLGTDTSQSAKRVGAIVFAALCAFGILRASQLAWVCDDAFISLRYAENLVAGHGLVYNVGERVEGYTNLLWTLMLAGGIRLGAPPLAVAQFLGIAFYALLIAALANAARSRQLSRGGPFLPVAAALIAVGSDYHDWATGGLETSLFAYLAFQGMWWARSPARNRALAAGVCFALLTLTRPDGLLFAGFGVVASAFPPRRFQVTEALKHGLMVLAPVIAVLLVFVPWKLHYYGELLPTAFYSKSVLRPHYSQGMVYLGLFLAKNWFVSLALLGTVVAVGFRWLRRGSDDHSSQADADSLYFASAAGAYLLYVVHVGGDFMFARRIVPAMPLLLFALEGQIFRLSKPRTRILATLACIVGAALPAPIFDEEFPHIRGIADERHYYPTAVIKKRRHQAEVVADALRDTEVRLMFEGGMCVFGYYSQLPYLVEMTGLTQYSLAKEPLPAVRGRIGHEKLASADWLAENDIHLILSHAFPPVPKPSSPAPFDHVYFGDAAVARVVLYDDAVMDALRKHPNVRFTPIEQIIKLRRQQIQSSSRERAERIYARLDRFYLRNAGERGVAIAAELRALIESKL